MNDNSSMSVGKSFRQKYFLVHLVPVGAGVKN